MISRLLDNHKVNTGKKMVWFEFDTANEAITTLNAIKQNYGSLPYMNKASVGPGNQNPQKFGFGLSHEQYQFITQQPAIPTVSQASTLNTQQFPTTTTNPQSNSGIGIKLEAKIVKTGKMMVWFEFDSADEAITTLNAIKQNFGSLPYMHKSAVGPGNQNPQKSGFGLSHEQYQAISGKHKNTMVSFSTNLPATIASYGGNSIYLHNHPNLNKFIRPRFLDSTQSRNRKELFNQQHNYTNGMFQAQPTNGEWELYYHPNPEEYYLPSVQQGMKTFGYNSITDAYLLTTISSQHRKSLPVKNDCFRALGKYRIGYGEVTIFLDDLGNKLAKPLEVSMAVGSAPNLMLEGGRGPGLSCIDDMQLYGNNPGKYKEAVQSELLETMKLAAVKNKDVFLTPYKGGGLFVNALSANQQTQYQEIIAQAYVDAVKKLVANNRQNSLKEIVLCVPDDNLFAIAQQVFSTIKEDIGVTITLTNAGTTATGVQIKENNPNAKIFVDVAGHSADFGGGLPKVVEEGKPGPAEEAIFASSNAPSIFLGKPPAKILPLETNNAPILTTISQSEKPVPLSTVRTTMFVNGKTKPQNEIEQQQKPAFANERSQKAFERLVKAMSKIGCACNWDKTKLELDILLPSKTYEMKIVTALVNAEVNMSVVGNKVTLIKPNGMLMNRFCDIFEQEMNSKHELQMTK